MKETIYFRHDSNAQEDPKIIKLRMRYGWEGYGLYRAILEGMRCDADVVLKQCDVDAFAFRSQYDSKKFLDFIDFCVEIELFVFDGKDRVFYSKRLQEDVQFMRDKSKKARMSAKARWKARSNAIAVQTQSDGNAIKDNIRKEIKEKEINILDGFGFSELLKTSVQEFIENRKQKKEPMTQLAMTRFLNKVKLHKEEDVIKMIDTAIINGRKDIYPEKKAVEPNEIGTKEHLAWYKVNIVGQKFTNPMLGGKEDTYTPGKYREYLHVEYKIRRPDTIDYLQKAEGTREDFSF